MNKFENYYKARDVITDLLRKDLIGPVEKDEILNEPPLQYYIMGKLYTSPDQDCGNAENPELDTDGNTETFIDTENQTFDAAVSLSNENNPSSLGITFVLKSGIKQVLFSGTYAFYQILSTEEAIRLGIDISEQKKSKKKFWQRKQYDFSKEITLPGEDTKILNIPLENNISLSLFFHHTYKNGEKVITAVLLNNYKNLSNDYELECSHTAFQVELKVSSKSKDSIFSDVTKQEHISEDNELKELEMLYLDKICYAQGHGCSVMWDLENKKPLWIKTEYLPNYELKVMKPALLENIGNVLSMKYLFKGNKNEIINGLYSITEQYLDWIKKLKTPKADYEEVANLNIEKCNVVYQRIKNSISLLASEPIVFKAFQLANEAMFMQQKQSRIISNREFNEDEIKWYPFQLSFFLQELTSIVKPESDERKIIDLLWFPTGGGKTEAYLGIAAFTIFLRRLRNPNDDGVTVLMRYTLRLLTIQQFERASRMICACELLRNKYKLGGTEISIGMWVGGGLTPNQLSKAEKALTKLQNGEMNPEDNPCQIKKCPWCGADINIPGGYSIDKNIKRMFIRCSNDKCDFHNFANGLPLHIVDESIYEFLPTYIVATVDKFALLALKDDSASLFGIAFNDSKKKNPPDLIIQDELHLISGPLGTMTGIYEAAITNLCKKNGCFTKVIASTATIRNASEQIKALYSRDFAQFPPQGIKSDDSFFAKESTAEEKPARQYFGVMGVGKGTAATTTLIRINAILLFASRYLASLGFEDEIIDNFWTITNYFNNLRELGSASIQIMDDVRSRYDYLLKSKFNNLNFTFFKDEKFNKLPLELTGGKSNDEITDILYKQLPRKFSRTDFHDVYDFLLATNMISVGVDVDRLGVMAVMGQPKGNGEYIQATSRVGRSNPGLVVTIYNPAKSRDRSHYEQFLKYHSSMYRFVEATSLTPFADRARDRGLHALFVILCRYNIKSLMLNGSAGKFKNNTSEVQKVKQTILDYVKIVDPDELSAVKNELEDIAQKWENQTRPELVYKDYGKSTNSLLKPDTMKDRFRTMNSLRSVDAESTVFISE